MKLLGGRKTPLLFRLGFLFSFCSYVCVFECTFALLLLFYSSVTSITGTNLQPCAHLQPMIIVLVSSRVESSCNLEIHALYYGWHWHSDLPVTSEGEGVT